MNNYLEKEKEKIQKEIDRIKRDTNKVSSVDTSLSRDNILIKNDELDKYNALSRMMEILNNNFSDTNNYEYLDLYEASGLERISDTDYKLLRNVSAIYEEEVNAVINRINEIIYAGRNNFINRIVNVDGANIKESDVNEYNALLEMKDFLDKNMTIRTLPQEYLNLKSKTTLNSENKSQDNSNTPPTNGNNNPTPTNLHQTELNSVVKRMNELITEGRNNTDANDPSMLVAHAMIKKSNTDEYIALNKMLDFLNQNTVIDNLPQSYIDLKNETSLGSKIQDNSNNIESDLYKSELASVVAKMNEIINASKGNKDPFNPTILVARAQIKKSDTDEFLALNEMLDFLKKNKSITTLPESYITLKSKTGIDAPSRDNSKDANNGQPIMGGAIGDAQISDLYKEESAKVIARINKLIDDGNNNTDQNDPTMIVARAKVKKSDTDEFIALNRMLDFLKNNKSITALPEDYITLQNRTALATSPNKDNSKGASNGQPITGGAIGDAQISDLYKEEYKKISDRLNVLIEQGKVSPADDPSVNINGVMIRQSNVDEFNALNEMINYLNQNKNVTTLDNDYLIQKSKTIIDKSPLYLEERQKIVNRMIELANVKDKTQDVLDEIKVLENMFAILEKDSNLQVLPQEYIDLKNKTALGTGKDNPEPPKPEKESSQLYTSEYKKILARMNELIDLGENNNDKDNPSVEINGAMIRQSDALEFNALVEMLKILNQNRMLTELPKEYIELRDKTALKEKKKDKDTPIEDTPIEDTPKKKNRFKVIAKKACKWLNEHKKQILIALGIAAIAVAVVVAFQYLIPAITAANNAAIAANSANIAAMNASNLSSLTSSMVSNSTLWHSATAAEQVALHASNQSLASVVQALTGKAAVFGSNGVWTFGGTSLAELAASHAATASSAAAEATALATKLTAAQNAVSALSTKALAYGLTGLGISGLGVILPNKKSKYEKYKKTINNVQKNRIYLKDDDLRNKLTELLDEIKDDTELRDSEKKDLVAQVREVYQAYLNEQDNSQKRGAK